MASCAGSPPAGCSLLDSVADYRTHTCNVGIVARHTSHVTAGHGLTLTVKAKPPHVTPVERRTFEVWFGDSLAVHFAIGIAQDRYDRYLGAVRYSTAKVRGFCRPSSHPRGARYIVVRRTEPKPFVSVALTISYSRTTIALKVRGI